jgi:hypothetical protein
MNADGVERHPVIEEGPRLMEQNRLTPPPLREGNAPRHRPFIGAAFSASGFPGY